ncbi:SDR family oxidoreductase [Lentibacillus cibarius]|uniref:SDR family oxidoreductase n=1 Tax=Lentibacillus cibarius TaxID=2583219 RepID=A0A5S3QID1_9BACI|nr:SDR family oxidoreductase [Lentibacillus cibarius]TMN21625.1 SDR family oxidoreductase [Lentibacillus cibarius]
MKNVLITGGNGDIAKAIVAELQKNEEFNIYTPGKEALDVTDPTSVHQYVEKVKPDILINNAGYIEPVPIAENSIQSEKHSIDVNLLGVFNCTGAVLEQNEQALIINLGSSAGTKPRGNWSSYCATKAGVIMATKCWADEGIKTVCLSPGRTKTKMRNRLYPDEDQQTLLTPQEFAQVVMKAIEGEYEYGANIDVSRQTIDELLV